MPLASTPQTHIYFWLQQSILHVAAYLESVGGDRVFESYQFLAGYLDPVREQLPQCTSLSELDRTWRKVVEQAGQRYNGQNSPLVRLQNAGLTSDHLRSLLFAGLVEVDARFGTVYSVLHPFPEEQRLTVGLLEDLLRFNTPESTVPAWVLGQDLERQGLLTRHHCDRPRATQALTVTALVWDVLCGLEIAHPTNSLVYHPPQSLKSFETLTGLLPADLLERLTRVPELIERHLTQGVILRGMRGTGRLRAIAAIAQSLNQGILHVRRPQLKAVPELCRLLGALAIVQQAIPILELELSPGENLALPHLAEYQGLFGVLLNREGSLSGPQVEECLTLWVPAPNQVAREQQWTTVLDAGVNGTREVVVQASQQYHLTLGAVTQAGRLAQAYAALNQHDHVELTDVREACRSLNQQTLENLATRMTADCTWDNLIVSDTTQTELATLIRRCRYRETLLSHLGSGFIGTTRGVRALFGGCSGTGKTLAARIIAAELGLDLYRVDLSAVVSKYIGETERNLSRLFARAEEQDIILLLDEGDSLLTARTDVRSSNDRYANLETNYLLQRLEQYEGIILITTNATSRIDSAFQRRIDVVVDFDLPGAGQRERLWSLHLPIHHRVSETLLRKVALRCQLTGGQIRNAVLHATLLAVEADHPISDRALTAGIQREYTKMGAASPLN